MAIMDSGSNYSFFEGVPSAQVGRSAFDKSYIDSFTAKQGQIIPCYTEYTMMRDTYKIMIEAIINVCNPPKVQLLSRQRAFFHFYWLSFAQIWKEAQIFFSKGRTTSQYTSSNNITVPKITLSSWSRGSLADYLGFNFVNTSGISLFTCNALKFMAYLRIVRDRYLNQRLHCLYLENVASGDIVDSDLSAADAKLILDFMYPADDSDFRIGSAQWNALVTSQTAVDYLFGECWYRNYADDYFTTAQTTPIYQNEPEIKISIPELVFAARDVVQNSAVVGNESGGFFTAIKDNSQVNADTTGHSQGDTVNYSDLKLSPYNGHSGIFSKYVLGTTTLAGQTVPAWKADTTSTELSTAEAITAVLNANVGLSSAGSQYISGLTMNAIRNCESATLILEKMAKCPNGSYGEFAKVMFGENPKSANDYSPYYIGGDYLPIVFTQVVNTAGTQNGNIQGEITGRGLAAGSGYIGSFDSDDFGLIIGVVSIMPDTYYTTGLQREDTYETAEDFFLPDRAELGMQAILNKEIYNDAAAINHNNDVFGYINRFEELRYRMNECHGLVADDSVFDFGAMIQSRKFNSLPTLTPDFVTTKDNIDNDWLSVSDMPPYIVQVLNSVRAIRPIPYKAEPATFGM